MDQYVLYDKEHRAYVTYMTRNSEYADGPLSYRVMFSSYPHLAKRWKTEAAAQQKCKALHDCGRTGICVVPMRITRER